ncbi:hypothetical protein SBA2_100047 [Acidobacteriia bacterium SbA2]|nr:hypothetical protein SBA2_100047 [Acidobacteriia bacterium SbA2]
MVSALPHWVYPRLKLRLGFFELDLNGLIILFKLNFFSKALMTFSRHDQKDSSFRNMRERVLSLCIGFRSVGDITMEPAGFELERQTRLADDVAGCGFCHHHVQAVLGNRFLLCGSARAARQQDNDTDIYPNCAPRTIRAKHG